jgi:hypothetical protein
VNSVAEYAMSTLAPRALIRKLHDSCLLLYGHLFPSLPGHLTHSFFWLGQLSTVFLVDIVTVLFDGSL